MCNVLPKAPAQQAPAPDPAKAVAVGQADTVKTPIGDTGAASAALAKKPKSLLSQAGASGDLGAAAVSAAGAKPTLGA